MDIYSFRDQKSELKVIVTLGFLVALRNNLSLCLSTNHWWLLANLVSLALGAV